MLCYSIYYMLHLSMEKEHRLSSVKCRYRLLKRYTVHRRAITTWENIKAKKRNVGNGAVQMLHNFRLIIYKAVYKHGYSASQMCTV